MPSGLLFFVGVVVDPDLDGALRGAGELNGVEAGKAAFARDGDVSCGILRVGC